MEYEYELDSELAEGCTCGDCEPACKYRMFKPCCGACMEEED